ncbi:MAG: DinB family protein [Vulcanimicrobiota bacterium]
MNIRLKPIAQYFTLSENFFRKSLKDMSNTELLESPSEHSNCMLWIAGHVTYSRSRILNLLGVKIDMPSAQLFARGSGKLIDASGNPGIEEILKVWDECTEALRERLEAMTDSELNQQSPIDLPSDDKSILGALSFFAFHETYHIGQMAYLYTWLGKGQLVG